MLIANKRIWGPIAGLAIFFAGFGGGLLVKRATTPNPQEAQSESLPTSSEAKKWEQGPGATGTDIRCEIRQLAQAEADSEDQASIQRALHRISGSRPKHFPSEIEALRGNLIALLKTRLRLEIAVNGHITGQSTVRQFIEDNRKYCERASATSAGGNAGAAAVSPGIVVGPHAGAAVGVLHQQLQKDLTESKTAMLEAENKVRDKPLPEELLNGRYEHAFETVLWWNMHRGFEERYGPVLSPSRHLEAGRVWFKEGRWSQAIEALELASSALPIPFGCDAIEARLLLGYAHLMKGDLLSAKQVTDKLLEHDLELGVAEASLLSGWVHICRGDPATAKECLPATSQPVENLRESLTLPRDYGKLLQICVALANDKGKAASLLAEVAVSSPDILSFLRLERLPATIRAHLEARALKIDIDGWATAHRVSDDYGIKNRSRFPLTDVKGTIRGLKTAGGSTSECEFRISEIAPGEPGFVDSKYRLIRNDTAKLEIEIISNQGSWRGVVWERK